MIMLTIPTLPMVLWTLLALSVAVNIALFVLLWSAVILADRADTSEGTPA